MDKLKRKHTPVPYPVASERVLRRMYKDTLSTYYANSLAYDIWPDHKMTSQGAGGAASRILKRMQKEGLVEWVIRGAFWGYVLTSQGRSEARRLETIF